MLAQTILQPMEFRSLARPFFPRNVPCSSQTQQDSLRALLPGELHGWSIADSARIFEGNDLYQFIDGGADLFLEYGFQRVVTELYKNTGGSTISCEVYEMSDPGAAFGIYSIRSGDGVPTDVGQGGSVHAYYVMFWKDRYYISIAATDSTAACRIGMDTIARSIDRNIAERGQLPCVVELILIEDLRKQQYVRGGLGLSTTRMFVGLGVFPALDAAIGTYPDHSLMVVQYNSTGDARKRLTNITRNFKSDKRFKRLRSGNQMTSVRDESNRTLCIKQSGTYLILSISSKEEIALVMCEQAVSSLSKK